MRVVEGRDKVQITFRLVQVMWGQGFATGIAGAVKHHAFTSLGLKEVIAIVDPANSACIKTLVKIGMVFDKAVVYEGLNLHVYTILDK